MRNELHILNFGQTRMKWFAVAIGMAFLLSSAMPVLAGGMTFQTINNPKDLTFNQLLGINNSGVIAGYFGNGMTAATPNKGYTVAPPYTTFIDENYPGSAQTQVTGINTAGNTSGFFVTSATTTINGTTVDINSGFLDSGGTFTVVADLASQFNQLLGLNDSGEAAGFYMDPTTGNNVPYTYKGGVFTLLRPQFGTNSVATGVNNAGEVTGFNATSGAAFLLNGSTLATLMFPGATTTQALGINNIGEIAGDYTNPAGDMHGFVYNIATGTFQSIDDPSGVGTTTINGLNDAGNLVGFYVDANMNTDGFLATTPEPASVLLFGTGLLGAAILLRRRQRLAARS